MKYRIKCWINGTVLSELTFEGDILEIVDRLNNSDAFKIVAVTEEGENNENS